MKIYNFDDIMTVGEIAEILNQYPKNMKLCVSDGSNVDGAVFRDKEIDNWNNGLLTKSGDLLEKDEIEEAGATKVEKVLTLFFNHLEEELHWKKQQE